LGLLLHANWSWAAKPLIYMGVAGIFINLVLMVLNLLPLPPLDGGRVLSGVLPGPWAWRLERIEPYGLLILLALLATGLLAKILWPIISALLSLMADLAGLSPQIFQAVLLSLMG
jgi:Zn-dependent protease